MIIYIEKQAREYKQIKKIIEQFKNATIIFVDNYKNIFDKKLPNGSNKNDFIVAKLNSPAITDAPDWYGHNNNTSYFFKTSLNCIFDCSYCFLKGAFKNDIPVYFVNYDDIRDQIFEKIEEMNKIGQTHRSTTTENNVGENLCIHPDNDYELKLKINQNYNNKIWFYSSDYSDILWMDNISWFTTEFVGFFEQFDNSMMEIRTKSANIKAVLDLWFVPKNTEFAFSLNPQELVEKYEHWTSNLDDRIKSINILLDLGYKVGLRFLPLLPVKNYEGIYTEFVEEIKNKIDMKKVSSTFVSWLLYTKWDYNNILKKYPKLDILYRLKEEKDGFIRENRKMRDFFYNLFRELDEKCFICLDEK